MKTIEQIKQEYLRFTASKIADCKNKIVMLENDDKKDEANLVKVQLNIYNIFDTLIGSSEKKLNSMKNLTEEEKAQKFCEDFINSLNKIPQNWRINYEKAKEYNDVTTFVIEEHKLSVVELLKKEFNCIING